MRFIGSGDLNFNQFIEEDLSAQEMIDFSPVYRCLHISTVLGSRTTFESYYRIQRTKQARLVIQPPTNMVNYYFIFSLRSHLQISVCVNAWRCLASV